MASAIRKPRMTAQRALQAETDLFQHMDAGCVFLRAICADAPQA